MADDWGESTDTKPIVAASDPWGSSSTAADDGWGSSTTTTSNNSGWGASAKPANDGWGGNSNNNNSRQNNRNSGISSNYGPKGGSSGWGASSSSKPEGETKRTRVNIPSQLLLEKLPSDTQCADLKSHFGRFGKITRIVMDYRFEEDKCFAWMDFENVISADVSITFHVFR